MKQEDKDLLLKDLCARLPYGVKLSVQSWDEREMEYIDRVDVLYSVNGDEYIKSTNEDYDFRLEDIKPYLFPLSSMTEEQKKDFKEISKCEYEIRDYGGFDSEGVYLIEIGKYEYEHDINTAIEEFYFNHEIIDWFNKNHVDYRDLIEKGLAIDATGLNIYKEEIK